MYKESVFLILHMTLYCLFVWRQPRKIQQCAMFDRRASFWFVLQFVLGKHWQLLCNKTLSMNEINEWFVKHSVSTALHWVQMTIEDKIHKLYIFKHVCQIIIIRCPSRPCTKCVLTIDITIRQRCWQSTDFETQSVTEYVLTM